MKVISYHVYFSIFGVLGLLISGALSAKGEANCEIIDESNNEPISLDQWYIRGIDLKPIDDVTKIDVVRRFKTINIAEVYDDEKMKKYIFVDQYYDDENDGTDISSSNFTLNIGEHFKNYEDKETLTVIKLKIGFYCVNGEEIKIEFRIPIRDTNNHDPEFLKNSYEYTLPMPIPKGYHLDLFEKVIVRDVDLTNDRITFSFDQDNKLNNVFNISSLGQDPQDKKNYLTQVTTASVLDLEDDITFNIIATDSGEPSRTSNATFTIKVDKTNSYPRFAQPLYTANLTKISYSKDDKILVKFGEGNVTVTRGYQGINSFEMREISDENMKHVKLNYTGMNSDNGMVAFVELYNVTEEFLKQKTMSFVLAAVRDHVEITTVVQILLPEVPVIESKVPCKISENQIFLRDDSTDVYMVATIILSLVSLGLTSFIIFLFINKKITWTRFY